VQLITDPGFAAGVVSQKNKVIGTLKGQGRSDCMVDYVPTEQPLEAGEWFYTSGDDRVFPKGLPVGQASAVRPGTTFKEIFLAPSGFQKGLDEVLVIVEGVHQQIPEDPNAATSGPIKLLPPPNPVSKDAKPVGTSSSMLATDADRLKEKYRDIGASQNHKFGEGMTSPNFNKPPAPVAPPAGISQGTPPAQTPKPEPQKTPPPITHP
jgi:rod shape-determining protein MreC